MANFFLKHENFPFLTQGCLSSISIKYVAYLRKFSKKFCHSTSVVRTMLETWARSVTDIGAKLQDMMLVYVCTYLALHSMRIVRAITSFSYHTAMSYNAQL